MENFDVKKFNRQKRLSDMKRKVRKAADDAVEWAKENRELVGVGITGFTGVIAPFIKGAVKRSNLNKEKDLKDLYCYDRSLGHYWELRRKLTNREWTEIENRKKNGEKLGDILKGMRVLR